MHSKKIIASGLVIGLTVSSLPTESMANTLEEYKMTREEKQVDSSNENNVFENLIKSLFVKKSESKEVVEVNKNIVRNSVYEITLGEGDNIEDLTDNPNGYETIVVKTTGDKLLDSTDFSRLNASKIPNIDLSNAKASSIPVGAFYKNTSLVRFKFPQGITAIGGVGGLRGPFEYCTSLIEISEIPDTVKVIGNSAFLGCSNLVFELSLPDALETVYNEAFNGCKKITGSLDFPITLKTLGNNAFMNCSGLTGDLIIPEGLTQIGNNAFSGCSGFDGRLVMPISLKTIGSSAFNGCSRLTGELVIPESVTSIGSSAFNGCSGLTGELKIPEGVTSIQSNTFKNCSGLTGSLVFPESVTYIGSNSFEKCSGFNGNLVIPEGVTTIDANAFNSCSGFIGKLVLPSNITVIGNGAFSGCRGFSGDFKIPKSVTRIGSSAFANCSGLTGRLVLPEVLTTIEGSAFQGCSGFFGELKIPEGVTSVGSSAFYGCTGFTGNLVLPELITSIGTNAFRGCKGLTGDLVIPSSVKSIGSNAFDGCVGFDGNLILSEGVETIAMNAFSGCSNLIGDVYIPNSVTSITGNIFSNVNKIGDIIIKVDENDESTEYKREIISRLPSGKVKIETPFGVDFTGTWIEDLNIEVIQPTIKTMVDGVESDIVDDKNEKVVLNIPVEFLEKESTILIDGNEVSFPKVSSNGKYTFIKEGDYELEIKTKLGTIYNFEFSIRSKEMQEAQDMVNEIIDTIPTVQSLNDVREIVNSLPESFRKEELQRILNSILVDLELERQTATSNLDVYIKSENMLKLSLDTNLITFENYSGTEDMIKSEAINLTVNSSLPYRINAYLESNIENKDASNTIDISLLNIKASSDSNFKEFTNIKTPVILLDDQPKGNGAIHSIDLKLKGSLAYKSDIYKTIIKLEVEQK